MEHENRKAIFRVASSNAEMMAIYDTISHSVNAASEENPLDDGYMIENSVFGLTLMTKVMVAEGG